MSSNDTGDDSTAKEYASLAEYYDLIYSFKDYDSETKSIHHVIQTHKTSASNVLLDTACGTAKHLTYFSEWYDCQGLDLSADMLAIAKQRLPTLLFHQADMTNFHLDEKFDVITCLFSSFGYIKTRESLQATWNNFANHLKPGGVAIVQPWVTESQYIVGAPHMTVYDGDDIKITRMDVSKKEGHLSILDFHILIAKRECEVEYFRERHELAMYSQEDMLSCIKNANLQGQYFTSKPFDDRGLYVACKV